MEFAFEFEFEFELDFELDFDLKINIKITKNNKIKKIEESYASPLIDCCRNRKTFGCTMGCKGHCKGLFHLLLG